MYSCYTRANSIEGVNFKAKQEVDRTTRCGDMAIHNFSKMAAAAIFDLFEPEIAPFDPSSPKTPPRTKHEVGRTTGYDGQLKFSI